MFVSVVDLVSNVLFAALDPHHLYNLWLVNKDLNRRIDDSAQDACKQAAMAKYKRMVTLPNNTVRIHSIYGKMAMELILPNGVINQVDRVRVMMKMDGRAYVGRPNIKEHEVDGAMIDLSCHVFHAHSSRLLDAEYVFIARVKKFPPQFLGPALQACIVLENEDGENMRFVVSFYHTFSDWLDAHETM
jgi:hypothetical protein